MVPSWEFSTGVRLIYWRVATFLVIIVLDVNVDAKNTISFLAGGGGGAITPILPPCLRIWPTFALTNFSPDDQRPETLTPVYHVCLTSSYICASHHRHLQCFVPAGEVSSVLQNSHHPTKAQEVHLGP